MAEPLSRYLDLCESWRVFRSCPVLTKIWGATVEIHVRLPDSKHRCVARADNWDDAMREILRLVTRYARDPSAGGGSCVQKFWRMLSHPWAMLTSVRGVRKCH